MAQSKSGNAAAKAEAKKNDAALMATWQRFLDYDQVSSEQKRSYTRLREIVITLSLLTSAGAVFSIYLEQAGRQFSWVEHPLLRGSFGTSLELLRVLLIIMPIASVTFMRYASQFASSMTWIEYRVGAETLRSEIYLYRMRAGDYKNVNDAAARAKLLDYIEVTNSRIDEQGATVPYMKNYADIISLISNKTDSPSLDDGFRPLNVDDYIEWRVRRQLSWYIHKIQRDYSTLQREQWLALIVGAFGAVLSGLSKDLVTLVAVTTAMGSALTARSETRMYGATYGIFHWTAGKLQTELYQWEILPEEDKEDPKKQQAFVEEIEKIFQQERELWRAQAMQSQNNSDNTIKSQLQQRVGREEFEAHRDTGLVPVGVPDDNVADDLVNYTTTQSMRVLKPAEVRQLAAAQNQLAGGNNDDNFVDDNFVDDGVSMLQEVDGSNFEDDTPDDDNDEIIDAEVVDTEVLDVTKKDDTSPDTSAG